MYTPYDQQYGNQYAQQYTQQPYQAAGQLQQYSAPALNYSSPTLPSNYATGCGGSPGQAYVSQARGIPSAPSMIAMSPPYTSYPGESAMNGPFKFTAEPSPPAQGGYNAQADLQGPAQAPTVARRPPPKKKASRKKRACC
mmetsp:Transcript_15510/g.34097  ORF Transcript_15510/g.34097 Transcript_15510/m.34097 type:complete len:140 (+) Transcript_15510:68-487(+)